MTAVMNRPPLYRRPAEIGRRLTFAVVEFGIKAYGAAATLSVALSDAETVGGKTADAVNAVPNLMERYREAKFLVEHREEIQTTLDYVHQNGPDRQQLETSVVMSRQTLESIETTYREVSQVRETIVGIRPNNILESLPRAKEHFDRAWAARPDLGSIERLADEAQSVGPFLTKLSESDIDFSRIYAGLLRVVDNFASDEIAATLGVMGAASALGYVLGMWAGYWGRRGRPGIIASTLQGWGARHFRRWYVRNLEYALGRRLYGVARERIQRDIVADPRMALDPEALQELERYFQRRLSEKPTSSSGSVSAARPSTQLHPH